MKIGYTGWNWLSDEFNDWAPMSEHYKRDYEQYIREIADLGYETAENFDFLIDYFEGEEAWFNAVMKKYGVKFANLYFYFTDDAEADYKKLERCIPFMKAVGADHMNMQGVMWKDTPFMRPTDKEGILEYARRSNKIAKICKDNGIKACMHPHMNTKIFTEEQIDLFVENTDPSCVYLCLDTAHLTLGGMDAPKACAKYAGRVGYMHLKDVDPDDTLNPEWPMRRFRPLGVGTVDLKGCVESLRAGGYDGILCVELDYQPVCNYKSAMVSRRYLHDVLGF